MSQAVPYLFLFLFHILFHKICWYSRIFNMKKTDFHNPRRQTTVCTGRAKKRDEGVRCYHPTSLACLYCRKSVPRRSIAVLRAWGTSSSLHKHHPPAGRARASSFRPCCKHQSSIINHHLSFDFFVFSPKVSSHFSWAPHG